jgi:outer membrane protein OmpA-like peptidoglycan-associated protein/tetratricopeptide (TPR) repeat protein
MVNKKRISRILDYFRMNFILLLSFILIQSANMTAMASTRGSDEFSGRHTNKNSKDIKLIFRQANLYFETRDYKLADQYYDSVINISPNKYPLAYYFKGVVCMNLEKYDDAIEAFTRFKKIYGGKSDRFNYRKLAAVYSASSLWAKNNLAADKKITVTHPGAALNHADIDFSPFPVDDNTIYYGAVYSDVSGQSGPKRQIYKAERIDGKWKNSGLLEGGINDPDFNTGNAAISADGKSLFFTRSRKNWQNEIISEIFMSRLADNNWQAPEKLPYPINSENYTSTQPALGSNLRTGNTILYFVSDRPGSRGGLDIWYTEYDNKLKVWKNPADLPIKVNSIGDECSPFYDNLTQTLYFSSKGRKNEFGGFDIYKSTGSLRKWTDAVPLPIPINSSFDDYYFSIFKNDKEGFFSSNRPGSMTLDNGTCCDDIYSFYISECGTIYSQGTVRNSTNYDVYDELNEKYHLGLKYPENNAPLADVPVELYLPDEKDNDAILVGKTSTDKSGHYSFDLDKEKNYIILVKNYGYFEKKVAVNTFNLKCSDTVNIATALIPYLPKVTIQVNIYYDFDKYNLTESAKQTIDTMMLPLFDMFPNGVVEIGSHTDSIGTELYNMELSQKRSESVVSYLISKGIVSDRLVAKGYGMSMPIAPNKNMDGSDNPEGRQLNRRTEMKIVGDISKFNNNE